WSRSVMKPLTPLGVLLLALGACAPAATTAGPPRAPAAPTAPAAPAVQPVEALDAAPEAWRLLAASAYRVRGLSARRAPEELLRGKQPERTIVVGVIDSGIDIEHVDLDDNLWVNEDEIAGNGRDDDSNGYVDDVHGWNFIGGPDGRHVDEDTYELARIVAD